MLDHGNHSEQSTRFLIVAALFLFGVSTTGAKLAPTIRLNNGYELPVVGLGTASADNIEQAVKDAIDSGYRHIDTAFIYNTEVGVGRGVNAKIAEGVVKREDIFITTKLWNTFHEPDLVEAAFSKSLENLNLTYVDLYLMHSPVGYNRFSKDKSRTEPANIDDIDPFPSGPGALNDVDYIDTWKAMENLVKSGRVRSIGVSNFNSEQVDRILSVAEIKPVVNQVECHPNLNQHKLLKFLADRNIVLVAYSPLGQPHRAGKDAVINHPKIIELANKYNKTPAQIILRYTNQNGAVVIPKSTNKERIAGNIDLFDFTLNDEDVQAINDLNRNERLVKFSDAIASQYYPFSIEF